MYARMFNNWVTTMIAVYRETGDRRVIAEVAEQMRTVRKTLKDNNRDGYLDWKYKHCVGEGRSYCGGDKKKLDEMMAHGMVAAVAYELKRAGYSSDARFWTSYLENHFERKWKKRNGTSSYNFLSFNLTHSYTQFIRYHYYMYKLTGESGYLKQAQKMASRIKGNMKSVSSPGGTAWVWDHGVSRKLGCQSHVYFHYTAQAIADLHGAGFYFSSSDMRKIANAVAHFFVKSETRFGPDICGGKSRGGIRSVKRSTPSMYQFQLLPFQEAMSWDGSGRIRRATERVFYATERHRTSNPKLPNLPAQMVIALNR